MAASGRPELLLRLLSAAVGLPLLALVLWAGGYWLAGVAAIAALIGAAELLTLQRLAGWRPLVVGGSLWAGVVTVAAGIDAHALFITLGDGRAVLIALGAGAVALAIIALALRRSSEAVGDWTLTVIGASYVSLSLAALVLTRQGAENASSAAYLTLDVGDAGLQWVALAFLATFATDTSAYVVGRLIGRRKMAPGISPGKTWEGAVGGLLGGGGATVGLVLLLDGVPDHLIAAVALGVGVAVLAQAGDLLESKLKRLARVKDSSGLIPGHGGLLDRLDSLVPVFPLVYYASRYWPA